jgi:hypothetical protein
MIGLGQTIITEIKSMRKLFLLASFALITGAPAMAQSTCSSASNANTLYCVPILAVDNLHVANNSAMAAIPAVPPAFSALNADIGIQLSEVPTPSPASGIVFAFGPTGLTRQRELGPIFSEAPPTVGRHKLYLAFTYQFLEFEKIDGVSLKQIPLQLSTAACIPNSSGVFPAGCSPSFIITSSRLDLKVNQFTAYATFGLFSRLDISVAVPILNVRMGMQTRCSVCSQSQPDGSVLIFTPNIATGDVSGIGDVTVRAKATVLKGERAGLALGVDVRTPTGNDLNFLGAGAIGVRPFAAFGYRARVSPHADIAYRYNGSSILASSTQSGTAPLPKLLDYSAGIDVGIVRSLSVTGDFLGQTFFNANRIFQGVRAPSTSLDISCNPTGALACQAQTFNTRTVAIGGKINPAGNLLISANVLIKTDQNGLHYRPAPMIGISYTF